MTETSQSFDVSLELAESQLRVSRHMVFSLAVEVGSGHPHSHIEADANAVACLPPQRQPPVISVGLVLVVERSE